MSVTTLTIIGVVEHKYDGANWSGRGPLKRWDWRRQRAAQFVFEGGFGDFRRNAKSGAPAGTPPESTAGYFSFFEAAVRRASSSERRMSIAIVASLLPLLAFSICSMTRTSVSLSVGRLTDVVAVGLSPFSA